MATIKAYHILAAALSFAAMQNVAAQGASFNNVWVGPGAEMHIKYTENVTFGSNVKTDRNSETSVISIAALPDAAGVTGHVDGSVKVYGGTTRVFPSGYGTRGSLIQLTEGLPGGESVSALYNEFEANSANLADADIISVLEYEHWKVSGNNSAKLTVSWTEDARYGDIPGTADIGAEDITIAAWDGSKWVALPSAANTASTPEEGSITTNDVVDFSTYTLFTLAFKNSCMQIAGATGDAVYNGVWTETPDDLKNVIIDTGLTVTAETSFSAGSLVLNADITISDGAFIEVMKGVTGPGKIIIESKGSFVQRGSSVDAPHVELIKQTRPLRKWDYAYWGTPVAENFKPQIANAHATGYAFPAFDQMYKYVSQAGTGGSWQNLDATVPGKGFITRVKAQAPFTDEFVTNTIDFPVTGTANNGNIKITLGPETSGARSYNLLANPYPSAIDAGLLLRNNPNLGGAIYLWTANEFNSAGATADYAVWNLAGSVVTMPSGTIQLPTGYIVSGQGFMVKALESEGTAMFTNCMRVTGSNDNHFRTAQNQADRYWLNMTSTAGVFSQILINYTEEATYGYDRLYDAHRNSTSSAQLYSFVESTKYAINSRPVFDFADIVPLGVSRTASNSGTFTITLHSPEGVFASDEVTIFIHDRLLDSYHNLNQGSYTFDVADLQNDDRFEIVYETDALGHDKPEADIASMGIFSSVFNINAAATVKTVTIYDLTGRIVQHYAIGQNAFNAPFNHSEGIYVAKALMHDGSVVTRKLVHKK